MESTRIHTLDPSTAPPAHAFVRAVVALSWPYSSSTKQCALLLADPDPRLRHRKGQVRVRFTGPSAEAVAKSRLGIGEEVVLTLEGATWAEQDTGSVKTPGRSVDGELVFGRRLDLVVARADGEIKVSVDAPVSPPRMAEMAEDATTSTPQPRVVDRLRSSLDGMAVPIYSSPAFAKRMRLSGASFMDSVYDPFSDDVGTEQPNKKLRTSFGGVGQWRYAARSPSPVEDAAGMDVEPAVEQHADTSRVSNEDVVMEDDTHIASDLNTVAGTHVLDTTQPLDSTHETECTETSPRISPTSPIADTMPSDKPLSPEDAASPSKELSASPGVQHSAHNRHTEAPSKATPLALYMPPPPLPPLKMPKAQDFSIQEHELDEQQQGPSTPELRAVPNSALPLPSPFPIEAARRPFDLIEHAPSSSAVRDDDGSTLPDLGAVGKAAGSTPDAANEASGESEQEDAMALKLSEGNGIIQDHDGAGILVQSEKRQEMLAAEPESRKAEDSQVHTRQPLLPPPPRTPAKLPSSGFSLDDSVTPAPQSQSTPQSERDRVMARTFSSLFGFGKSPAPQLQRLSPKQQEAPTSTPMFGLSETDRARFGTPVTLKQKSEVKIQEPEVAETQYEGRLDDEAVLPDAEDDEEESTGPQVAADLVSLIEDVEEDAPLRSSSAPDSSANVPDEVFGEEQSSQSPARLSHAVEEGDLDEAADVDVYMRESSDERSETHGEVQGNANTPPTRAPEDKSSQASVVTVIELESGSDVDEAEHQLPSDESQAEVSNVFETMDDAVDATETATMSEAEDEIVVSNPIATRKLEQLDESHDADAEIGLSSPLATSQLDQLEDEVRDRHTLTDASSYVQNNSQRPLSSSPVPRTTQIRHSSSTVSKRELFPGGPLAFFPEERIIEDSYDEVSATISTQPTPQADDESEVIIVPDQGTLLDYSSMAGSVDQYQPEDDEEDMEITPIAPTGSGSGEDNFSLSRTAHSTVIELGSSSPIWNNATSPVAVDVAPSPPVTQMLVEENGNGIPDDEDQVDHAETLGWVASPPLAFQPLSSAPVQQTITEDLVTSQPDAESHVNHGWQSSPEEAVEISPKAVEMIDPLFTRQFQLDEMLHERPEDDIVSQAGSIRDLDDTEMLEVFAQDYQSVTEAFAEVQDTTTIESHTLTDFTPEQIENSLTARTEIVAAEDTDSEVAESEMVQSEGEAENMMDASQSFETQIAVSDMGMLHQSQHQTLPDSAHEVNFTAEDSMPFETQIAMSVVPVQEQTPDPSNTMAVEANSQSILPPSPLASQAHKGSQSLESAMHLQSETLTSALPPTPQLTQAEPDRRDAESHTDLEPSVIGEQLLERNITSLNPNSSLNSNGTNLHQEPAGPSAGSVDYLREAHDALNVSRENVTVSDRSLQAQEDAQALEVGRAPLSNTVKKIKARKSLTTRLSNVPDVISAWFSPKRSGGEARSEKETVANGHSLEAGADSVVFVPGTNGNGFSTPMGYFTPLARVGTQLNPSSQQAYGNRSVDILAVVSDRTKAPERAKVGPRDYFTCFHVTDASLPAGDATMVEVFRPWKATLPVAEVGDVVLLRAFTTKSKDRKPYLLSTDSSAWCVWRFVDAGVAGSNEGKPVWARKRSSIASAGVREEANGPPVEFGEEEREHARALRDWWVAQHPAAEIAH